MITMAKPFPREHYRLLDQWTREFADQMMDDFWPRDYAALAAELDRRAACEITCMVAVDGSPAGFIGYAPISRHLGAMRGVVFSRRLHGDGTAHGALREFLDARFREGVHKILCSPFADNSRAIAFLRKLGAQDEALLREHTLRGGRVIDVRLMAFFASAPEGS